MIFTERTSGQFLADDVEGGHFYARLAEPPSRLMAVTLPMDRSEGGVCETVLHELPEEFSGVPIKGVHSAKMGFSPKIGEVHVFDLHKKHVTKVLIGTSRAASELLT